MRLSQMFFKTYKETPADAEIKSHKLLLRAGYIKKQASGVYVFLPLGKRVLNKLINLIREEMDGAGANEVLMSNLLPLEVYEGRVDRFGSDMFKLHDRTGKSFCLGPTHEEAFTSVVKDFVTSYKQLPVMLYQIQTKFRDEVRPRFGLMRGKEFLMKDAYSFDIDTKGLDKSYNIMLNAYKNIFDKLGFDYVIVDADSGTIGGSGSQEFMVKSQVGEDDIVVCNTCGYAANTEKAECMEVPKNKTDIKEDLQKIHTPNLKTIQQLVSSLNKQESDFLKAVVYSYDKGVAVALVPGDREVQEAKLVHALDNTIKLEKATIEEVHSINSVAGFVGAMNLNNCIVVADNSVKNMQNFIIGANEEDYHYTGANLTDLKIDKFTDIKTVQAQDLCKRCGVKLKVIKGIEVGHIFKLQDAYTKLLNCKYLDEFGKSQYMQAGSYGIGVTRTLSALVEQYSSDKGIVLPEIVAPYKYYIVIANNKDEVQVNLANKIYDKFLAKKEDVLLDDRFESIGVKLNDGELVGVPYLIVVGRDAKEEKVELINRLTNEKKVVTLSEMGL